MMMPNKQHISHSISNEALMNLFPEKQTMFLSRRAALLREIEEHGKACHKEQFYGCSQ